MKMIRRRNLLCKPTCGTPQSRDRCYIRNLTDIPMVMTGYAADVLDSTVTIANNTFSGIPGTINFTAVQHSTSPGMVPAMTSHGATASPFSVSLTGLQPDTTYYYRATVESTNGLYSGAVRSFRTSQAAPPTVVTGDAVNITPNSALIINNVFSGFTGSIDFVAVQYDVSPTMSNAVMIYDAIGSPFSVNLAGLQPNTTYYYRAVVSSSGSQYNGEIKSFTTPDFT